MPVSLMKLIKNSMEFQPQSEIANFPKRTRGIYVLYRQEGKKTYAVVYIGMVHGVKTAGIGGRLRHHRKTKGSLWTHFSAFEVWDNISEQEVEELEGILRHIYRYDPQANALNKQGSYKPLNQVRKETQDQWKP